MKRLSFLFILLLPFGFLSQAQTSKGSKYGSDSATCISNLSTMIEFTKIKVFDYALPAWRSVFNNCPRASKNIYLNGATIFKNLIEKQEDMQLKDKYIDTLMMIYDQRIQYFNEEGFVLIRKGMDLLNYRPSDKANIYKYLDKGIQLSGEKVEMNALIAYLQVTIVMANEGTLSKDKVIENYNLVSKLLDQSNDTAVLQTREVVDKLFAGSGAADCNKTNDIYMAKLNAGNVPVDQLKQTIKILENSKCTETTAYAKANEMLFVLEPSSSAAFNLARSYYKKQDFTKAEEFYLQAIKLETNPDILATYYYELAVVQSSGLNQNAKARESALKAASYKKDWGQPYILLGNIYVSSNGSCSGTEIDKLSVFWAAVDKFSMSKSVDTKLTDEANALIAKYSVYFPNSETLFFYGLKPGDSYVVKCGFNETTRVRAR
jgi:tetratricopeptide (TPR) repeat protein